MLALTYLPKAHVLRTWHRVLQGGEQNALSPFACLCVYMCMPVHVCHGACVEAGGHVERFSPSI